MQGCDVVVVKQHQTVYLKEKQVNRILSILTNINQSHDAHTHAQCDFIVPEISLQDTIMVFGHAVSYRRDI